MKRSYNGHPRGPKLPLELLERLNEAEFSGSDSRKKHRPNTITARRREQRKTQRSDKRHGYATGRDSGKSDLSGRSQPQFRKEAPRVKKANVEKTDDSDIDTDDFDDDDSDTDTDEKHGYREPQSGRSQSAEDVFAALRRAKEMKSQGKLSERDPSVSKREKATTEKLNKQKDPKPASTKDTQDNEDRLDEVAQLELSIFDAEIEALEARLGKGAGKETTGDEMDILLDGIGRNCRSKQKWTEDSLKKLKAKGKTPRLKPGTDVLESDDSDVDSEGDFDFGLNSDNQVELGSSGDHTEDDSDDSDEDDGSTDWDGDAQVDVEASSGADEVVSEGGEDETDDYDDADDESDDETPVQRVKENPYRAPVAATESAVLDKRTRFAEVDDESHRRLERQIQGQINRISEPSLVGIARTVGDLYRANSRNATSSTIVKVLLAALDSQAVLSDSFLILHASFGVAMVRVAGVDLAAMMIEKTVEIIAEERKKEEAGKQALNLVSFLCYLFVFGVSGPTLIFDYIRRFLQELSETNTEFLLRIIRCCGPQLRQDDPGSLKDIVILLQSQIAQKGLDGLSVRTKFMIETIDDLKNNKLKQARMASVAAEQIARIKKMLTALPKQPEPLQVGLEDLEDVGKKGKWWVVGASWKGNMATLTADAAEPEKGISSSGSVKERAKSRTGASAALDADSHSDGERDVDEVGRRLGMNTDIRRAIFSTIVTSPSPPDGYARLLKLRLTKQQQLQIPRVLVQAALAEQLHNPFYSHLARNLCAGEHRFRKAFQFVAWDYWKRMGILGTAGGGSSSLDDDQDDSTIPLALNEIVNLGKLYAHLVATETQPMGAVLKPILESTVMGGNAPALLHPPKQARLFLQLFFFALFQDASSSHRWTPPRRSKRKDDDDLDDWERPFAGLGDRELKDGKREKEDPKEVIMKLVGNVTTSHPDSAESLLFFANKHIKIRDDGSGGVAGLASKKSEVKKARNGWAAMEAVLKKPST